MKVMGFEHIFEKAVQFKLKPGGNLEKILLSAENKSNVYILSLWLISFSLSPPPHKSFGSRSRLCWKEEYSSVWA